MTQWSLDRFVELKFIEHGSFADVHHAIDADGNNYALKKISRQKLFATAREPDFQTEVRILNLLSHPNIIKLHGSFQDKDYYYLVLEWGMGGDIQNCSIERAKQGHIGFDEDTVKDIVKSMVEALMYCHSHGVIHRDVKPENILIMSEQPRNGDNSPEAKPGATYKLCDFGLSALCEDVTACERQRFCGSPYYMPPEMLKGQRYNYRVDLWQLGILTYELLTGFPPFIHEDVVELYSQIVKDAIPLSDAKISKFAREFIANLTEKNPEVRMSLTAALAHPFLSSTLTKAASDGSDALAPPM